jgi:hypothetical protein
MKKPNIRTLMSSHSRVACLALLATAAFGMMGTASAQSSIDLTTTPGGPFSYTYTSIPNGSAVSFWYLDPGNWVFENDTSTAFPDVAVTFTINPGQPASASSDPNDIYTGASTTTYGNTETIDFQGGPGVQAGAQFMITISGNLPYSQWIYVQDTPEPSTLALLGIGASLVGYARRRRMAKA